MRTVPLRPLACANGRPKHGPTMTFLARPFQRPMFASSSRVSAAAALLLLGVSCASGQSAPPESPPGSDTLAVTQASVPIGDGQWMTPEASMVMVLGNSVSWYVSGVSPSGSLALVGSVYARPTTAGRTRKLSNAGGRLTGHQSRCFDHRRESGEHAEDRVNRHGAQIQRNARVARGLGLASHRVGVAAQLRALEKEMHRHG